jgi:hypothetical protein
MALVTVIAGLTGLTGQSGNPRAVDIREALRNQESGGHWIARSSRAMTSVGERTRPRNAAYGTWIDFR